MSTAATLMIVWRACCGRSGSPASTNLSPMARTMQMAAAIALALATLRTRSPRLWTRRNTTIAPTMTTVSSPSRSPITRPGSTYSCYGTFG
jgi:hypothetical protein